MQLLERWTNKSWWIFTLIIILCSLVFQVYSRACGLVLTPDSISYLSAARSFETSFTFLTQDGNPFIYWPPLFPVILSLFDDPVNTLSWINILLMVAISLLISYCALILIENVIVRSIYLLFILPGVHLLMISSFLWSELIFVFFMLVFLLSFEKRRTSNRFLYISLISGFLLCIQRNAGLFVISGAILCELSHTEFSRKKLFSSILFFLFTTSGFWIWNVYVSYFTSSGLPYFSSITNNSNQLAKSIIIAFIPVHQWSNFLFFVMAAGVVYLLRNDLKTISFLRLIFFVVAIYLIGLSLLFPFGFDESERFIAAILPLFSLLVFRAFSNFVNIQSSKIRFGLLILFCCTVVYPFSRTIKNMKLWHSSSCSASIDK